MTPELGRLLYQWSTAAQLVSVLMIALFYATLARSIKRDEVSWWAQSWWANFGALVVTVSYWLLPPSPAVAPAIRALYVGGKIASVLLLIQGALAMRRPGTRWLTKGTLSAWTAASAVGGVLFLASIDRIGVAVQGVMGLLMLVCAGALLRERDPVTGWLGYGFLLRGVFCAVEALAYLADSFPAGVVSADHARLVAMFLGTHSSVDLAGDWLLALGGMVAITRRTQVALEGVNAGMLAAQEQLRDLADRDPLTGLANRRALPEAFRSVFECGASVVFCDLDEFKQVNDTYGHTVGDECLTHFARQLRASFRPTDTIVRYAGDEFLVVAREMETWMAQERIDALRAQLMDERDDCRDIRFSAGVVELAPGGDAETALRAADSAMYAAKNSRALGYRLTTGLGQTGARARA